MSNEAKALPWQSYELNHQQPYAAAQQQPYPPPQHDAPTLCAQPAQYYQQQYAQQVYAHHAPQAYAPQAYAQQAYAPQAYAQHAAHHAQQQYYYAQQHQLPGYLAPAPANPVSVSPPPAAIARGSAPSLLDSKPPAAPKPDKRAARQAIAARRDADRKAKAEAAARAIAERHGAVEKQLAAAQEKAAKQLAARQASAQHKLIELQLAEVKRLERKHAAAIKVVRDRHAKVVRRAVGGVDARVDARGDARVDARDARDPRDPRTTEKTRAQRVHRAKTVKPGLDDPRAAGTGPDRLRFIRLTYLHLALAIGAFAGLLYLLMTVPVLVDNVSVPLVRFALGGRWNWGVVLAAFMAVSFVADQAARHSSSRATHYLGLLLYVAAEAVIFVPLLAIVEWKTHAILARGGADPHIIRSAAVATLGVFSALTVSVLLTRKDFSFLAAGIMVGTGAAAVLIGMSLAVGFDLGLAFSVGMVALAGGYILVQTSEVLRHHDRRHHVAAALALFASVALMFWYVIRILVRSRD